MGPSNDSLYLIQHLSTVLGKQAEQLLQERLGISLSQYKVLMALEWNPRASQRGIADSLGQTEAAVSRQVRSMAAKGLVTSKPAPGNRRRYIIAPTPRGMQITETANEVLRRGIGAGLSGFDEDLQKLHRAVCGPGRTRAHQPGL